MKRKQIWKAALLAGTAGCAALAAAGGGLFSFALKRREKPMMAPGSFTMKFIPVSAEDFQNPRFEKDWWERHEGQPLSVLAHDGVRLSGTWFRQVQNPSKKVALLLHGYGGKGRHMQNFAQIYWERGYDLLIPDARAHGKSEGRFIGMGWTDRLDELVWLQEIIERIGEDAQIVLHGVSMGGATVCMTCGETLPAQVKCAVSDCAYTSVEDEFAHLLDLMFHLPREPVLSAARLTARLHGYYDFREASALRQVARSKTPILFIHGEADTFVPFSMMQRLYDAAPVSLREKHAFSRANHGQSLTYSPEEYIAVLDEWLSRYIRS